MSERAMRGNIGFEHTVGNDHVASNPAQKRSAPKNNRGEALHYVLVEDSAEIIQVSERDRIFERFYRIPGTTKDGSGLGLAIVKDIASLHGADLRVRPRTNGQGNCFEVCFPIAR
ncbi:MAG: sensor histidine kinase [Betaproteobacteria bacterium]|nr:sensor histidine kinase [Betaproteobacteria bacterium]